MINLEVLSNVSIDILDTNNEHIEKMNEPSDIGWLATPQSPIEVTFFPSNNLNIQQYLKERNIVFYPVKYIPFDIKSHFNEILEKTFYGLWIEEVSLEESRKIAQNSDQDYFFFSFWDTDRIFGIYETNSDKKILFGYSH